MDYKKSFRLYKLSIILFCVLLLGGILLKQPVLTVIGLVLLAIGSIQMYKFYRCPNCGAMLFDQRWRAVEECPFCGENLKK